MPLIATPTTVISVRGRRREDLEADPAFLYVGRRVGLGTSPRWPASDWGNPFKPGMDARAISAMIATWRRVEVIDRDIEVAPGDTILSLYERWVLANPKLRARLPELRSRVLGCWCGSWRAGEPEIGCHAVVLARLCEEATVEVERDAAWEALFTATARARGNPHLHRVLKAAMEAYDDPAALARLAAVADSP